ncbi:MAG: hypothetical protein Q9174_007216 [Haloplaca sp. 1 TL-2023]
MSAPRERPTYQNTPINWVPHFLTSYKDQQAREEIFKNMPITAEEHFVNAEHIHNFIKLMDQSIQRVEDYGEANPHHTLPVLVLKDQFKDLRWKTWLCKITVLRGARPPSRLPPPGPPPVFNPPPPPAQPTVLRQFLTQSIRADTVFILLLLASYLGSLRSVSFLEDWGSTVSAVRKFWGI